MSDKPDLVPPWASPTEKGIFCTCCKQTFPDVPAFEAHLLPKNEQLEKPAIKCEGPARFDCYD